MEHISQIVSGFTTATIAFASVTGVVYYFWSFNKLERARDECDRQRVKQLHLKDELRQNRERLKQLQRGDYEKMNYQAQEPVIYRLSEAYRSLGK